MNDEARPLTVAPDWYAIEQECRHSALALAVIARKHRVSYEALLKRSARGGWRRFYVRPDVRSPRESEADRVERPQCDCLGEGEAAGPEDRLVGDMRDPADLRAIPLHRALVAYVGTRHAPGSDEAYTERAVLEGAALQIEMIRQHRGDIRGARELALTLLGQLQDIAGHRDELLRAIDELAEPGQRRQAMHRAIALPTHIAAMRDLSTTLRQLIPLERQALGIAEAQPLEPIDPRAPVERAGERPELAELERAIDAQLMKCKARSETLN